MIVGLAIAQTPWACEVKLVFNRWCLGASAAEQLKGVRIALQREHRGQRTVFLEEADNDGQTVMLTVFEERVAGVSRMHVPGTSLTYRDLLGQLTKIYGEPEDFSSYPAYATDWDSRQLAIDVGKGRASHSWAQAGFRVTLRWSNKTGVLLVYHHLELTQKAVKAKPPEM